MSSEEYPKTVSWLDGIRTGNQQILELIFKKFQPLIIRQLERRGAGRSDAEDCFMDALEDIYRRAIKRDDAFIEEQKFERYLQKASLYQWYSKCRRAKKIEKVTLEEISVQDYDSSLEEELVQSEKTRLIWAKFEELDQKCQTVLRMFLIEKKSLSDIATVMGYTYEYAKKKKYRCYKYLKMRVKEDPLYNELIRKL